MAGKENVDPDIDNFKPTKREKKGSIKPSKRFKLATNDEEVNVLTKGYTPDNTKKNTAWSLKVFNEWRCSREGNCPADLLTSGKTNHSLRATGGNCPADLLTSGKTNHSLRATGATPLFQKNVPERIVQKVTGHRSVEALRFYERISVSQNREVSKTLMTNMQSESVAVKCDSQQMFRSLGGINHCSIENITFNIGNQQAASE